MGRKIEEPANETSSSSLSSFDALLFTTMCMIGLPVEVKVKDGSVYTGIFHTASVEGEYGVVLKKASVARKGEGNTNLSVGAVVDTLVVLSGDLVQVVVKGVLVPADGIVGNVDSYNAKMVTISVQRPSCHSELESEPKVLKSGKATSQKFAAEDNAQIGQNRNSFLTKGEKELGMREVVAEPMESMLEVENGKSDNIIMAKVEETSSVPLVSNSFDERQGGKGKPQGEDDGCSTCNDDNMVHRDPCSSSTTACIPQQNNLDGTAVEMPSKILLNGAPCASLASPIVISEAPDHEVPNSTHFQLSDAPVSNMSFSSTSVVDISATSCQIPLASPTESVPSKNSVCNTNCKEFKLNPGAKTFSPSFTNPRSTSPAVTAAASVGYAPSSSPVVPIVSVQPGVEISPFTPRTSVPVKFVQYSNLMTGNSGGGTQYGSLNSLPTAGHVGSRQQPVRYSNQYQTGSAYAHPNSQTVMVGRLGQVVYVHPIPHDAIQGAAALSQGPARPMLAPHQVHLPKHQVAGTTAQTLQPCMTPPFLASGQQSFAVPTHIPFSPSYPAIRSVSVPDVNSVFGSKFH